MRPRPRRPDEAEARIVLLEQRVTHLENRLKTLESDGGGGDLDVAKVIVKPEDTAGTPPGWGARGPA